MSLQEIVVGVDGTRAGYEAARQAARLAGPEGRLTLVAVADAWDAVEDSRTASGDADFDAALDLVRARLADALERATAQVSGLVAAVETRLLEGRAIEGLPAELERSGAGTVAIGSHGRGRATPGIALGSVASSLLHAAEHDVLIARAPLDPAAFPESILVGVDGSHASRRALALAAEIAKADGAHASAIAVSGRDDVQQALDDAAAAGIVVSTVHGRASDELVRASRDADLVVVGGRGLRGRRVLGAVSERVAQRAHSSVLVAHR